MHSVHSDCSRELLSLGRGYRLDRVPEESKSDAELQRSRRCHDNSNPSYSPICTSNPTLRPGCTHGRCSTVASLPKQIFYSRAPGDDDDDDDEDEEKEREEAQERSWRRDEMPSDSSRDVKKRASNKAVRALSLSLLLLLPYSSFLAFSSPSSFRPPIFTPTTPDDDDDDDRHRGAPERLWSGEIKGIPFLTGSHDLPFNLACFISSVVPSSPPP